MAQQDPSFIALGMVETRGWLAQWKPLMPWSKQLMWF